MTQTTNRFFDEVARLMNDAAGVAQGVRREFDTLVKTQTERWLRDLDLIKREEFEAVKDMARLAREENEALKVRIAGPHGHLDNDAAAALLAGLDGSRLQHVVAAHLSEKNNTPWLARSTLGSALGGAPERVEIASQDGGLPWRELV